MRLHIWMLAAATALGGAMAHAAQNPQQQRQMPTPGPPARAVVGVRTVATVKQVMRGIVIPASDLFFKAARNPPSDDAGWNAVQLQALTVAEGANLLMIGNRPIDRAEWMRLARVLVEAAAEAADAAGKKDGTALSALGDKVHESCEGCHAKYMKK